LETVFVGEYNQKSAVFADSAEKTLAELDNGFDFFTRSVILKLHNIL
jgi:hypothetical protein